MAEPETGLVTVRQADLQRQATAIALFDKVWNDPTLGSQVRARAKEIDPSITIPDDRPEVLSARADAKAANDRAAALEAQFAEFTAKADAKEAEKGLRDQLGKVQTEYGFTDDGMTKVIDLMRERNIADPEAAAELYKKGLPKPQLAGSSRIYDSKADLFGTTKQDDQWAKLHSDPDGFFSDVVNEVFSEFPAQG